MNKNNKQVAQLWQRDRASDCPFVRYKNFCSASFSFVTIHPCDRQTDGQTDRQTDGRTDRLTTPKTAFAYARAVKTQSETLKHTRD